MDASTKLEQHQMAIVCPVLAAMVKEGKLPMDADGNVKFKDLRAAGRSLEFSKPMELSLPAIALGGNTPKELLGNLLHREFNVLELRSGLAKHAGDSAILNSGKFDDGALQCVRRARRERPHDHRQLRCGDRGQPPTRQHGRRREGRARSASR